VAKIHLLRASIVMRLMVLGLFVSPCIATAVAQKQPDDELSNARSLLQKGKNSEAIALLKTIAVRRPELKGVNHELGAAYYREGEFLEAAKYLQDAWNENQDDHDAAQLLGLSYYFSGRPIEAIPALEKVRSWHPEANIDALYILAVCYAVTKRHAEALGMFAHLYGVRPDSAAAHLLMGRMLLRQGLDPIAESEIRTALRISPQMPLGHLALGELNLYGGNYFKAAQEFEMELALNPTCTPALTHLAEVLWRLNRDDDSQKVLRRTISLDPMDPAPYVVLGKVLLRQGQLALAEKNLHRAVTLDPSSYTAHYFLGQLYRDEGKSEAAQREMNVAARIQQLQAVSVGRN
jgi:tetratricopeptide (TPR) repeat protein